MGKGHDKAINLVEPKPIIHTKEFLTSSAVTRTSAAIFCKKLSKTQENRHKERRRKEGTEEYYFQ
jgi:hypothetical protein